MPHTPQPEPTDAVAIRVDAVSKTFRTWASPAQRLIVPMLHRFMATDRGFAKARRVQQHAKTA